jgi:hypothetical protein
VKREREMNAMLLPPPPHPYPTKPTVTPPVDRQHAYHFNYYTTNNDVYEAKYTNFPKMMLTQLLGE